MKVGRTKLTNFFAILLTCFTFFLLYLPIIVLVVFSFNSHKFPAPWSGFTLQWYRELFQTEELWSSFFTSLFIGISSTALSLFMSILLLFFKANGGNIKKAVPIFYGNLLIPESLFAISLLSFFSFFDISLGYFTLIIAHTVFGLGFTVPIIYTRYCQLDTRLIEASLSLGATSTQTFFKVVIPHMRPAILASGLLVFILSFDDFILSYFTAGTNVQTLSLYLLTMLRTGISPIVNALSAFTLLFSSLLVMIFFSPKIRNKVF